MIKGVLFVLKGECMMFIQHYPSRFFCWIAWVFCMGMLGCSAGVQPDHDQSPAKAAGVQTFDSTSTVYSFKLKDIDGWPVALSRYQGKVALVVNVASECRFTHQYTNLQRLYMKYRDQGFVVLGFPADDFGKQEPGTNAQIKEFVADQYNIMFPLFSKISVEGEDIHPLYQCLTSPETSGEFVGPITWNFNKFLIGKEGTTIARFDSEADPLAPQITEAVEAALQ
jgi:glutathione peroxidase-family protein